MQEQLPQSLKHRGDTRPWTSMCRRAESVDKSYDALVPLLTAKDKLPLIASVNRALNREIFNLTKNVKEVFESLEKADVPTLNLVVPSYYLLTSKFVATDDDSKTLATFKAKLLKYMDSKYYTSVKAMHWMACYLDPTFKKFSFMPATNATDVRFLHDLESDLPGWLLAEMIPVAEKLTKQESPIGLEDETTADSSKKKQKYDDPFDELRQPKFAPAQSRRDHQSNEDICKQELAAYRNFKEQVSDKNPLNFWKCHQIDYPILSQVARRLYCISARSAQSERDFSSLGRTITDVRSRISSKMVEAVELVNWGKRADLLE